MKLTIELDSLREAEEFGLRLTPGTTYQPTPVISVEQLLKGPARPGAFVGIPEDPKPEPASPAAETAAKVDAEVVAQIAEPDPATAAAPAPAETAAPPVEPEKPRRGRPKKEKVEPEAPAPVAEQPAEPANDGGFEVALAELEAQMKTAGKSKEDVEKAVGQWREMGPAQVEKLKGLVQQNRDFLAKKAVPAPVVPAPAAAAPSHDKAPGEDLLRSAGMDFMANHDMNQLLNLLSNYGCARVIEMAGKSVAEQWEFIEKCKAPKAAPNA